MSFRMAVSLEDKLKTMYQKHFSKIDELPDDLLQRAFRELNETDEMKRSCLKQLRDVIGQKSNVELGKEVQDLFGERGDGYLLRFLRARKYDVDRSYEMMIEFVRFRNKFPEISKRLTVDVVTGSLQDGFPGLLPFRDKKGRAVLIFAVENWNPKQYPVDTVICAYIYLLEHLSVNQETQINGFLIVQNMARCTMAQAMAVKLVDIRKLISLLQNAFPGRFKGLHIIYEPWYFRWFYAFIKPFLKEKIARRVHIHGTNLGDYLVEFDEDFLPEEYGGKGPAYHPELMMSALSDAASGTSQNFKKFVKKAFSFF